MFQITNQPPIFLGVPELNGNPRIRSITVEREAVSEGLQSFWLSSQILGRLWLYWLVQRNFRILNLMEVRQSPIYIHIYTFIHMYIYIYIYIYIYTNVEVRQSTKYHIFGHILWGYSLKHWHYVGLIFGRYLQFTWMMGMMIKHGYVADDHEYLVNWWTMAHCGE